MSHATEIDKFMQGLIARNPHEPLFHQAVEGFVRSVWPVYIQTPEFVRWNILERMTEPQEALLFSVPWVDDQGNVRVQKGYRVHFNNTTGPWKGGLRFHPSVSFDEVKFLGFKQVSKDALTGLMLGGAKGGSDFNPKGKSDLEVMRFCQMFMLKLKEFIGRRKDIPAGDIGVGIKEIGYLFGMHKMLTGEFTGTLTGKGYKWGGSLYRPEATGYGLLDFVSEMLKTKGENLTGKLIAISGSGNVAQYATEEAMRMGGRVVTSSDSSGTVYDPEGFTPHKLKFVMELKNERKGRIKEYAEKYGVAYHEGKKPWQLGRFDIALPCATENELDGEDARILVENGVICVAEGANMPSTPEAITEFLKAKILYGPGNAANAGGVAVSGLEMAQNGSMLQWEGPIVRQHLRSIMKKIHAQCVEHGNEENFINYIKGADIAGFLKVAHAMVEQGVV